MPKQISSPVKCPDFKDEEETRQKKSRRTSVRKKPAEKPQSMGSLESPCQDRRSDNSKNLIKSSSSSPDKSEKGKQKMKAAKSFTETKTHVSSDAVKPSSCLSPPAKLCDAAVGLSKETSTPLQKIPKRARLSLSSLVRSFTVSGDSKSAAPASTDGPDDVFEDYFSPANHHNRSKRPPLPNPPTERDIQIPFELDPVPNKRKQRRSESIGSEANSKKKRKVEESQQSDVSSEPQSHPQQQDVKESVPALERSSVDVALVAKRRRQSTLPFTSTGTTKSDAVTQRRRSVQPTVLKDELQKISDVSVLSHTLESE